MSTQKINTLRRVTCSNTWGKTASEAGEEAGKTGKCIPYFCVESYNYRISELEGSIHEEFQEILGGS